MRLLYKTCTYGAGWSGLFLLLAKSHPFCAYSVVTANHVQMDDIAVRGSRKHSDTIHIFNVCFSLCEAKTIFPNGQSKYSRLIITEQANSLAYMQFISHRRLF